MFGTPSQVERTGATAAHLLSYQRCDVSLLMPTTLMPGLVLVLGHTELPSFEEGSMVSLFQGRSDIKRTALHPKILRGLQLGCLLLVAVVAVVVAVVVVVVVVGGGGGGGGVGGVGVVVAVE